jgi:DNA-binding CsgD family transcriptional regulator
MDLRKFLASTGKVIASSGTADFPGLVHGLLATAVEFDGMDMVEWQVDDSLGRILAVNSLGRCTRSETTLPSAPTVQTIIHMHGTRLLRDKGPLDGSRNAPVRLWQCYLASVSRRADRRYLISLCRGPNRGDFSHKELDLLADLSEILLPVVEQHALTTLGDPLSSSGNALLRIRFSERIRNQGIDLSPRELQVCSSLLAGLTIPELAAELHLKCSTVETYVKRATIKLGVNGRHGLTRWAMG